MGTLATSGSKNSNKLYSDLQLTFEQLRYGALLVHDGSSGGNSLSTFRHNRPVPSSGVGNDRLYRNNVNLFDPELFFLVLAHPVYKMRIIQEPNMIEL